MKSLVAAMMALAAVFAFTSTTAASAASKKDEMMQRITEREMADIERIKEIEMEIMELLMLELEALRNATN